MEPNLELLYAGAMFHDLGLTERYRTSQLRFEVDSANAARKFLLEHDVEKADADKVWLSIALHTTPGHARVFGTRSSLGDKLASKPMCSASTAMSFLRRLLPRCTAAHPRPDFKQRILAAFNDGMKHRPHSTFGTINDDVLAHFDPTFVRVDFVEIIINNTWPE